MAKDHHCPTCGVGACNAASNRMHVCPRCYTRWEEVVGGSSSPPSPEPAAEPA